MSESIGLCSALGCRDEIYPHEGVHKCHCGSALCKKHKECARCEVEKKRWVTFKIGRLVVQVKLTE